MSAAAALGAGLLGSLWFFLSVGLAAEGLARVASRAPRGWRLGAVGVALFALGLAAVLWLLSHGRVVL